MLTALLALAAIDAVSAATLIVMNYKLNQARKSYGWMDAPYMPETFDNQYR